MQVLKFGGTSVANAQNIKKVRDIVAQKPSSDQLIIIFSAISGTTDRLLQCGRLASGGHLEFREILQQLVQDHRCMRLEAEGFEVCPDLGRDPALV